MKTIYIYSDNVGLAGELVGFAREAEKKVCIITFDEASANQLAQYGSEKVYLLQGDHQIIENNAKAVAAFLQEKDATTFIVGATSSGRDLAARVAGYLDAALVSDITGVRYEEDKIMTERIMFGGAVIQSETVSGPAVITIPAGKFTSFKEGQSDIETVKIEPDKRVVFVNESPNEKVGIDITLADKVIGVGLGVEKEEDMEMVRELAEVLGDAGIGGTRGICEIRNWLPDYIGISGLTVKPSLYLSLGISGQIQHVVGIRDSKTIVAIDVNEKASIFEAADYGIVGDLYELVPLLIEALKNK